MSIIDHRQGIELVKKWRKEHPEEAIKSDKEWEEMKNNPEKLKEWLEKKGFHFKDE